VQNTLLGEEAPQRDEPEDEDDSGEIEDEDDLEVIGAVVALFVVAPFVFSVFCVTCCSVAPRSDEPGPNESAAVLLHAYKSSTFPV
jgi:hypothetical protein